MITIQGMRKRMPLLVFILLAIFCLVALGIACACASNHSMQNIDRAAGGTPAATPLIEVWTFTFGTLALLVSLDLRRRRAEKDISPATLQCFLF